MGQQFDRDAIQERDVDRFLEVNGVRKLRWYQRDISRGLTKSIGIAIIALFLTGSYYVGAINSALFTLAYIGGIGFLVALYLTYTWQWPRLIRYFRKLWTERHYR